MLGKIITSIKGLSLDNEEIKVLNNLNICGVILFKRNFSSPKQLKKLTTSIKKINPNFLISVDHEGGRVWRFDKGFTKLPAMSILGEIYKKNKSLSLRQAFACGVILADELFECGVDFSFTPVLDINYHNSSIIGNRSFSEDPKAIIKLAKNLIDGMHFVGMKCVGKHFPGHGFVKTDSHLELPVDNRTFAKMQADINIFKNLSPTLDAIMPAHIVYSKIDDMPAGFSKKWMDILRYNLNFNGVIISDDLSMQGAKFIFKIENRVKIALKNGADIVLICNDISTTKLVIKKNFGLSNKAKLMQAKPNFNYTKMDYLKIIKNIL